MTERHLLIPLMLACGLAAGCKDDDGDSGGSDGAGGVQDMGGGDGTDGPDRAGWRLIWQDEFDGPAGQSPDPTKWAPEIGGHGWGNQQLEHNTGRPENASLDGAGNLAIVARRETYEGNGYTSARLATKGLFSQTYGRFEARVQLPIGQGIWPAFWMLGDDIDTVGWPACGEIDILEFKGQDPAIIYGTVHGPGYSAGQSVGQRQAVAGGNLHQDFHVYAVEWDADRIRWFVDDFQFFEVEPADLEPNRWVFDHPHFLILNVAVGGTFVGPLNAETRFPQTMLVDYVRVYERDE